MRLGWLGIVLVIGCGSEGAPSRPPADAAPVAHAAPLDAAPRPPPPPPDATVTIARGQTLAPIAEKTYGSRHYADVIAAVNHVSPSRLKIGQELALPALETVLTRASAPPALIAGVTGWLSQRDAAWAARRGDRAIDAATQTALHQAATDVRAGAAALAPGAAATGFTQAADAIDTVAAGKTTANGYDVDAVDRRLAEGIAHLRL